MLTETVISKIKEIVGEKACVLDEPMSKHTTFRIGGPAKVFCEPQTEGQLESLIKLFANENILYTVIGNGSNLLVSDNGYDGVIIRLLDKFSQIKEISLSHEEKAMAPNPNAEVFIEVEAGARNWNVGSYLLEKEVAGFEFATGIPGTIGGAVMMNAGAYGGELKDIVCYAEVLDAQGNFHKLSNKELEFGYRESAIHTKNLVVVKVVLGFTKGDPKEIKEIIYDLAKRRRTKQPLEFPSGGSTFKRPEGHYASQLIDEAGLRGFTVGGAQVAEKHAGFVINKGDATAEDVVNLVNRVSEIVFEKSGVHLEMEVRKLGF